MTGAATGLSNLERDLLRASAELVRRQQEVLGLLGATLDLPPEEIFYRWEKGDLPAGEPPPGVELSPEETWIQTGRIRGTDWGYFFHGFECDIGNYKDGRVVRVEFGPRGRLDTISVYAVLQFVMTSKAPWLEFPDLQEFLAEKPPPYDEYSGSHSRACDLWDRLEALGFLEPAAPDLIRLLEEYRTKAGSHPRAASPADVSYRESLDYIVAYREVLTDRAWTSLASR